MGIIGFLSFVLGLMMLWILTTDHESRLRYNKKEFIRHKWNSLSEEERKELKRIKRRENFKYTIVSVLVVAGIAIGLIMYDNWNKTHEKKEENSSSDEYWEDRAYKVPEAPSSWVEVSEEFYIGPDAELTYNNRRFINFSDEAVRGVDAAAPTDIRTDEADRGFRLIVMDDDTVYAQAYNNTNEDIIPLGVQVQSWDGDYEVPIVEGDEGVIITGYKDAPDGFGFLVMYFSNGDSLALGVYKQNGDLYAFNILPMN